MCECLQKYAKDNIYSHEFTSFFTKSKKLLEGNYLQYDYVEESTPKKKKKKQIAQEVDEYPEVFVVKKIRKHEYYEEKEDKQRKKKKNRDRHNGKQNSRAKQVHSRVI